jgi:hypothetical protein
VELGSAGVQLKLPFVEGLQPKDLLALRNDHRDEFECFRRALVAAIREQVTRLSNESDPVVVARAVREELIDPSIADIERKLRGSRRAMGQKLAATVAVGSVVTLVGLLDNMSWLWTAAIAVGTGGSSLVPVHNRIDDVKDIKMNDMYFMFRVKKRHSHS